MGKMRFQIRTNKTSAERYLDEARSTLVETRRSDDRVRIYLMREYKGVRFSEYVFDGLLTETELTGKFRRPYGGRNRPGPLGVVLLALLGLVTVAAVFGAIYLCALLIARNPMLSLYIALPVFAIAAGTVTVAACFGTRRRKQKKNLEAFLSPVATRS